MDIIYPSTSIKAKKKKEQNKDPKIYPQGYFKPKHCKWCEKTFTPNAPSEHYCSDNCKHKGAVDSHLLNAYGITIYQYDKIWVEQKGLCKLCGSDGLKRVSHNNSVPLVIDHDHKTHKVRGLLCHTCNTAIGQLNDDPVLIKKALDYVKMDHNIPTSTETRNRITRNRKTSNVTVTESRHIIDLFLKGFNRKQISDITKISEGHIKGIVTKTTKVGRKLWDTYYKDLGSSTTIPNGSTPQANGGGSGSPLTGNAEGDDIVSSA